MPALARARRPYPDTACAVDSNVCSESSTSTEQLLLHMSKHAPQNTYYCWTVTLHATLLRDFHREQAGWRAMPRDVTLPREKHNLHENGYGDYCSYIVYLAARSSVPMGISLKTWAKPSNQLCDKLCPAAGRAFRTRALIAARSLEVP